MKRCAGYTLTELFVVLAAAAFVFGLTGKLFGDGWVAAQRAAANTRKVQAVRLVADRWRQVVHRTRAADWRVTPAAFQAGGTRVSQEGPRVVFAEGARTRCVALPDGVTCRFAAERTASGEALAVMRVAWDTHFFRYVRTNAVSVVACAGEE